MSDAQLASQVLDLLRASNLKRRDEAIENAAALAQLDAPKDLSGITPRFEAFFAIATLGKALKNREDANSIQQRHKFALLLTTKWIESEGLNKVK